MRKRPVNTIHSHSVAACLACVLGLAASIPGLAAQVCTTQQVGNDEFRGISGTTDSSIYAVAKKGGIYQFDGSAWSAMSSAGGEDLNAVHATDNGGFAVGKKGEAVALVAGAWTQIGGFTKEDLYAVWAVSNNEVYAGGKKGSLYSYNGVGWTDRSSDAGTGKKDIVDIWSDASLVYALDEDGFLYRYDRIGGTWFSPDAACDNGDKFTGVWGDTTGNVFLTADKNVYLYDGSSCSLATTSSSDLLGVFGWNTTGDVTAVGKKGVVMESDSGGWAQSAVGNKELTDVWVSPTGNAYFSGKDKSLTVCECTDCSATGEAQFLISHDSYGIHCQAEVVQVQVLDALSGAPKSDYVGNVTLDTQNGFGSWTLLGGSGGFSDSVPDDGAATYVWAAGESTALFALSYPQGPDAVDVDVFESGDPTIRDTDTEGTMQFSASGFSLTAAPLPNPVSGAVVPFAASQVAGSNFVIHVSAYGATPGDPECGVIESYGGTKSLQVWMQHVDPGSGTLTATVGGTAVGTAEAAATSATVDFTDGQASVIAKYKDVGRIQLQMADPSPADPDLAGGIRGATAAFVVKPFDFVLSDLEDAGGTPNPAATDADGDIFVAAGEPFSATVTARDAEGSATPNYGQESIPETVELVAAILAPAGGNEPPVDYATGFATFSNGRSTGGDFSWPEVGIVTLRPEVGDGDYLGAGNVLGSSSGTVGRFVPHHFDVSLNLPAFSSACAAGSFSYVGQPLVYAVAPEITFSAKALAGQTTENYAGGFFKMTTASLPDPQYAAATGTLDTSGLPGAVADPAVTSLGAGIGTLTFSSGSGLLFERNSETAEFDAEIRLSMNVMDDDGVAAAANPVIFGAAGGMAFDSGPAMRFGRLTISNAFGSELVDLPMRLRTEYYVGPMTGFVENTADSCTIPVVVSLDDFTANLASGDTCVMDSGFPGASGAGCAGAAAPGRQFRSPPLAGNFNLYLAAPGDTNDGSVDVTVDAPAWLEYDWDAGAAGLEDPVGTAVFGIFEGGNKVIYTRELY